MSAIRRFRGQSGHQPAIAGQSRLVSTQQSKPTLAFVPAFQLTTAGLKIGRAIRGVTPALSTGTGSILDVGCGTGSLSFCLARNPEIASVCGLDFSSAYVDHAKRRNHDARLDFQVGDACGLPFPNASFDHALSMLALQFIPQAGLAVREMRRVTRPGGTVAAATWDTRGGLVSHA